MSIPQLSAILLTRLMKITDDEKVGRGRWEGDSLFTNCKRVTATTSALDMSTERRSV